MMPVGIEQTGRARDRPAGRGARGLRRGDGAPHPAGAPGRRAERPLPEPPRVPRPLRPARRAPGREPGSLGDAPRPGQPRRRAGGRSRRLGSRRDPEPGHQRRRRPDGRSLPARARRPTPRPGPTLHRCPPLRLPPPILENPIAVGWRSGCRCPSSGSSAAPRSRWTPARRTSRASTPDDVRGLRADGRSRGRVPSSIRSCRQAHALAVEAEAPIVDERDGDRRPAGTTEHRVRGR